MDDRLPNGITVVAPSVVGVDETFSIKIKVTAEPAYVGTKASWNRPTTTVASPFNLSPRGISYMDDVASVTDGTLDISSESSMTHPCQLDLQTSCAAGKNGDARPIVHAEGFSFSQPGVHFIHVRHRETGTVGTSNAIRVQAQPPTERLYWGDLHVHTYFTDAIRVPEELYKFARDEAFLDVCALTDHSEGISDAQWRYFVDVTNRFNKPGSFTTLVAGEWTSMTHGHRNYYYRGDDGPVLRCNDPEQERLQDFHAAARAANALVIPHHSANTVMGCDWDYDHPPDLERLVEIHSVLGNSERPADQGNPFPIRFSGGEQAGRHVVDGLARGHRLGFVGSGDIHDGRPGDSLTHLQEKPDSYNLCHTQGIVGIWAPSLTREDIFDALWNRRVFATMNHRTLLRFSIDGQPMGSEMTCTSKELAVHIEAASDQPIAKLELVGENQVTKELTPGELATEWAFDTPSPAEATWYYVRLTLADGRLAWSSPIWLVPA